MVERVYCFIWVQILKTKIKKKNKKKTKYNTQEQQWRRFHREMNSGGRRRSVGAEVWCEWLLNHVCQQETGLTRIKWQTEEDKGVNCETDKSGDARRESFHLKADRKYVTQIRYRHECRKTSFLHEWLNNRKHDNRKMGNDFDRTNYFKAAGYLWDIAATMCLHTVLHVYFYT